MPALQDELYISVIYPRKMIQEPTGEIGSHSRSALEYYNEGLALGREGRDEEDITLLTLALAVNPALASAWVGRGFALGKLGRFQEEIECCDQALSFDPACIDAWNYKGFALGKLGRFEGKSGVLRPRTCTRSQERIRMEQQGGCSWHAGTIRSRDLVLRPCTGFAGQLPWRG